MWSHFGLCVVIFTNMWAQLRRGKYLESELSLVFSLIIHPLCFEPHTKVEPKSKQKPCNHVAGAFSLRKNKLPNCFINFQNTVNLFWKVILIVNKWHCVVFPADVHTQMHKITLPRQSLGCPASWKGLVVSWSDRGQNFRSVTKLDVQARTGAGHCAPRASPPPYSYNKGGI